MAKVFGELLGTLIGLVVLLYILPLFPFITSGYWVWLPIGITATIVGGLCKIFSYMIGILPLARLFRIASHAVSFYSVYNLRKIFPFDFGLVGMEHLNTIFSFALLITLFALVLATIIEIVKLITLEPLEKEKKKK